jgi:hypothetical protein
MSRKTPRKTDAERAATADLTDRAAFTVEEFRTRVVPMGRAQFYEDVKNGRIRIVKRGHRTYVPADEGPRYVAQLAIAAE